MNNPDGGDFRLAQTVVSSAVGNNCAAAGTDPRCSTSVPVASMHILGVANVSTTKPGSVVDYTGTFSNTGQVPYVGVSVVFNVLGIADDASYNGDATATAGTVLLTIGAPTVTWTGDLAVGATVTFTTSVTVNNPDEGDKVLATDFFSTAPANNCPPAGSDPACASRVTVLIPALALSQAADTFLTTPGSVVGYTVTIHNTGPTPYAAAVVQDQLAGLLNDATYSADATATSGEVSFTAGVLTWTGDLALEQTVVIGFHVLVDDPDLGDKVMVAQLVSDELGSTCPAGGTDAACASFVLVQIPALAIYLSADTVTTTPGSTVSYTLTIQNMGQTGYLGATVASDLSGVLDDAAYGRGEATTGAVVLTGSTLTWTGDLAVGAAAVVTYSVDVGNPDNGNQVLTTEVTSAGAGSTCPALAPCGNVVTVLTPGLAVSTSANVATATPGDAVTFTIALHNTGQTAYVGTSVTTSLATTLDDATFDGTVNASSGVASFSATTLSWIGSLAVGATVTITYTVIVDTPDTGNQSLTATVVADTAGSTCPSGSTDPSCTASVTILVPALTITKSAGAPTTTPGSVVVYTVVAHNTGQTAYLGAVLTDPLGGVLADATYDDDAVAVGGGSLAFAASTLTWTLDLPVGASASVTYSVTVHNPDTGDKLLTNTVTSPAPGSTCPATGIPPAACSATVQVLVPGLVATQTVSVPEVTAGGVVGYTITVHNTGETDYEPATVTDPLGGLLDDASYGGDAVASVGTVVDTAGVLVWTGPLPVGATATVTFSVTTTFPPGVDRSLTNTIFTTAPGSNCVGGAAAVCSTQVSVLVPALVVSKTADVSQVNAGGKVNYTISATNAGEAAYPGTTLTDSLAEVLDVAAYDADAVASSGALSFADETLAWTGTLAVGATVVITYSATVGVTDADNDVLVNTVVSDAVGSNCATDSVDPACSTTTTIAARSITLSGLTPSFTLSGLPGSVVTGNGAVTMTVTTNSTAGYTVTVEADSPVLAPHTPGNVDSIPVGALRVRESGTSGFLSLLSDSPLVVHQQNSPSGPNGDAVSNDFQIQVPFVNADTYSGTLEYIAVAQ